MESSDMAQLDKVLGVERDLSPELAKQIDDSLLQVIGNHAARSIGLLGCTVYDPVTNVRGVVASVVFDGVGMVYLNVAQEAKPGEFSWCPMWRCRALSRVQSAPWFSSQSIPELPVQEANQQPS